MADSFAAPTPAVSRSIVHRGQIFAAHPGAPWEFIRKRAACCIRVSAPHRALCVCFTQLVRSEEFCVTTAVCSAAATDLSARDFLGVVGRCVDHQAQWRSVADPAFRLYFCAAVSSLAHRLHDVYGATRQDSWDQICRSSFLPFPLLGWE